MRLGIENKIALVTGASRNIGKAITMSLQKEVSRLVIVSRDTSNIAKDLLSENVEHLFFDIDLLDENAPSHLIDFLSENNCQPDIVVHNLGGSLDVRDPFAPLAIWKKVWRYNLGISHELNCSLIPQMKEKGWGRIVHLSTLSTETFSGNPAYISAKCALEGYVKKVGREVSKHNVVMCAVAPGLVDLDGRYLSMKAKEDPAFIEDYYDNHLPIRRMCQPAEIGNLVAYMWSQHSAYMPGSIVRIDGGGY